MVIIVVEAEEELGDDDRDGLGDQSTEEEEDALGECSVTGVRAFRLLEGEGIAKTREAFASNLSGRQTWVAPEPSTSVFFFCFPPVPVA